MKNRSRTAAKVTGVVAAGALVFGMIGAAGAAPQPVEYRLSPGTGNITLPTSGDPVVIALLDATGVTGTYDDVSGAFSGNFTTAPIPSSRPAPAPAPAGSTISQVTTLTAPNPVTGTIDPVTGLGTVSAGFNVSIYLESLVINPTTAITLDTTCTIAGVNVTYNVTATKDPADSVNFTKFVLASQPFTVPTTTCVAGPNTNPAVPTATVQAGLITALALPNANATSALTLIAGPIPAPPVTTTTTPPTTAAVVVCATFTSQEEAQVKFDSDPVRFAALDEDGDGIACVGLTVEEAQAVVAQARFTG